jgi:hypothetical protein
MCERCDQLRAAYRAEVTAYKAVVKNISGTAGDDFYAVLRCLEKVHEACLRTGKTLNDHWYQEHAPHTAEAPVVIRLSQVA